MSARGAQSGSSPTANRITRHTKKEYADFNSGSTSGNGRGARKLYLEENALCPDAMQPKPSLVAEAVGTSNGRSEPKYRLLASDLSVGGFLHVPHGSCIITGTELASIESLPSVLQFKLMLHSLGDDRPNFGSELLVQQERLAVTQRRF